MAAEGSITHCIERLTAGDRAAAERLWGAYSRRLVGLARARLRAVPRGAGDEEDVALSAFDSFLRRAEGDGFPDLAGRDDLWKLLLTITVRKAIDLVAHETCARRGGGRVRPLADLDPAELRGLEHYFGPDPEPTPAAAALLRDQTRRLLDRLDPELQSVALWKLDGATNREIAARLGCVEVTVERKLRRIRKLWSGEDLP